MPQETARFYTKSRRFPKMIGRMNDGSRIPGGPYTLTQVGVGGAVLLAMFATRGLLWSTGEILLDILMTAVLAFAVTWLVGRLPMTRRNLLFAFLDAAAAMFKPFGGKYQGQVIRLSAPHGAGGGTRALPPERTVSLVPPPPPVGADLPPHPTKTPWSRREVSLTPPAPISTPAHRPATGLERLLTQVNSTNS